MNLQEKILSAFVGKVVRKDLAFLVKGNLPVPTYVLEYLLGQYCASDDEQIIEEGLEKVKDVIRNNYVHRAEAEEIKGKIREKGRYRVIDKITVALNDSIANQYEASFANLGLSRIPIADQFVIDNPKLLSGNGVWCIVTINYLSSDTAKIRWEIDTLKPIQISSVDLDEFIRQREMFTTEEWIDFLMHTVGLSPELLNRREKLIVLARLLPHVENNFNFMELGPKGTGKSHVFQELSPYGVLVSGGDVTSARLFVKYSGNKELLGLVGYWDVVAWDEFEQQKGKTVDPVMIDTMQNYLANKSFNRGKGAHEASASMAFVGNTKHTVPYMLKNSHLFESIPVAFIKGAFLDRIHLYNPGWEIKMLKKDSFSKGYGLITDYIAAILHELRKLDYSGNISNYVKFDGSLSERDHLAIRKTFSGMTKLLYPNGKYTEEEVLELIDFAAESRKRVKDQLYIIDETFKAEPAKFEYLELKTGNTRQVETLERIENPIYPALIIKDEELSLSTECNQRKEEVAEKKARPRIGQLPEKQINIRLNQKGISYRSLFADYLKDAKLITITDPFIRLPYQIRNLLDFIQMLIDTNIHPELLDIVLKTQNEDSGIPEMIDVLDDIAEDLQSYGVQFKYSFDAAHDRSVVADNGWSISLGRGLDIFEPFGKYALAQAKQENRRCKEFTVIYMKSN